MVSAYSRTSFGLLKITAVDKKITAVEVVTKQAGTSKVVPGVLKKTQSEIEQYFKGLRKSFSVPLFTQGTPFQKKVWKALTRIPYGKTVSYQKVADSIGRPKAVRAVASAIGANPICILIPCHRVIGASGALTGYAYGLNINSRLLRLEGVALAHDL